ncbi:MAG: hypothetical protein WBO77_04460 [Microgenomates group bacterium]
MKLYAIIKTYHVSAPNKRDAVEYFNNLKDEAEKEEYIVSKEVIEVLN